MENTDDFIRRVQEDELHDATKLTPIDYAKSRGMSPQLIYYYLRNKQLVWDWCDCGRKVIVVAEADQFFAEREAKKSEASRLNLDTDEQ